ncbi:MAG TPA: hypothetical protein VI279_16685 [Rhodocyclaceae bacterium]
MNILKKLATLSLAAGLLAPLAHADDIDLFQGGSSVTGNKPNVLIILDNSANWNSNAQGWPGGIKQGQSELNALNTVLGALTGDVRVGLEFFVKGAASVDSGLDGGYIRYAVRDMSSSNRSALQAILSGIYPDFNNEHTGQQVASANTDYGAGMTEAYRYFSGMAKYGGQASLRDYSGNGSYNVAPYQAGNLSSNALANSTATTYASPLSTDDLCGKNFIIFIGNGFPSTTSTSPVTILQGDGKTWAIPSGVSAVSASGKTPYSDIWAYYLKNVGVTGPCDADGNCANGKVVTYTIDVFKDHQDSNETALLKNMANLGGGKYFAATSETAIRTALSAIFNEIQAVNSVFTSASLPVSVNTQGTYLNQIYMGVFRPDSGGKPRWLGNLKQYKFNTKAIDTGYATLSFKTDNVDAPQSVLAQTSGGSTVPMLKVSNPPTGYVAKVYDNGAPINPDAGASSAAPWYYTLSKLEYGATINGTINNNDVIVSSFDFRIDPVSARLTGHAEPGSTITISDLTAGSTLATITADTSTGSWTTPVSSLTKNHNYTVDITTGYKSLFLADGDGKAAVNAQSGFITPTARSYWSACPSDTTFNTTTGLCNTTATAGFWSFNPQGTGTQYDAPDGDLVEKGAAGQKLRVLGPTARTVYTCSPACVANTALRNFDTNNADAVAAVSASSATFGTAVAVNLSRSGTTVTGTTTTSLGLGSPKDVVSITGTPYADYNSVWDVDYPGSGNTFTFSVTETPATPATGTMTVAAGSAVTQTASSATLSNGVVTINLSNHGLANGQQATISGATLSAAMSGSTTEQVVSDWAQVGSATVTSGANSSSTGPTSTAAGATASSSGTSSSGPTTTTDTNGNTVTSSSSTTTTTLSTPKTDSYTVTAVTGGTATATTEQKTTTLFTPCTGYPATTSCEYNGSFNITYVDANNFRYTPPTNYFGSTVTTTHERDKTVTVSSSSTSTPYSASYTTTQVNTSTTTSTTSTTWAPAKSFISSLGTATIACKQGGSNTTYSVPISAISRVTSSDPTPTAPGANATTNATAASAQKVTISLDTGTSISDCNTPFTLGSGNKDLQSMSITGSNAANGINVTTPTLLTPSTSCSGTRQICFNVTVTASSTNVTTTTTTTGTATDSTKSFTAGTATVNGSTTSTTYSPDQTTGRTTNQTTTLVPTSPASGTVTVSAVATRNVTSITRTAGDASNLATVTVTTSGNHGFTGQSQITVAGADQTDYNGSKTTAANSLAFPTASTITYTLTTGPATPTSGNAAKGYAVDVNSLMKWVRGVDNRDDENANGSFTDVRASVHGDVLHSRPLVINYGGSTGIVAFYGANDGTFHAVKGGQDESISALDGTEKWAFVAPEHYGSLIRLYNNSPVIKFPNTGTQTPTPIKRDYFFDGNIGVYQSADLATTHVFIAMRRGGRFLYALDVSNPDTPKFLWSKSYTSSGMSELGYTWSEPKVIPIRKTAGVACSAGDSSTYTRALIFGAGYDPSAEDIDNQGSSGVVRTPTMGRGVFVLDASDGSLIKKLAPASDSVPALVTPNANSTKQYSFPADVTVLDTDGDGCIDRVYAVDTGANIHRYDIADADPANWKSYKIASLGDIGNNGGSDDRKFLYPVDVVQSSDTAYLLVGSGNRETPLATSVADRFFMIKDTVATGADPTAITTIQYSDLTPITDFNSNTSTVDGTDTHLKGWYVAFDSGEKTVNAALTASGICYFGTNTPKSANSKSCEPNLGTARGYALNFLNGTAAFKRGKSAELVGGGLPPSPVAGVVMVDGKAMRFLIGTGGTDTTGSPIEGTNQQVSPANTRKRSFWYFKRD